MSRSLRIWAFVSMFAACAPSGQPDLVLWGARLIDGTGAPPSGPVAIEIQGGQISAIRADSATPREGANAIDITGSFVVPGFVDLHVHLPPDSAVQDAILSQMLRNGITTILNPGAREGSGVRLRDRLARTAPRMLTAGSILEHRAVEEGLTEWATLVSTETEAREAVRAQARSGVDFIKFYSGVAPDLAASITDEAAELGIPVIAHAGATTWEQAADAGVSMLVHSGWSTPMDELVDLADPAVATDAEWYASYADAPASARFRQLSRRLVASGVTVVPTLAITQAGGLGRDDDLLPRFETHLAPEADLPGWWGGGWRVRHPQYGDVSAEEAELLEAVYWPGVLGIIYAWYENGVVLGVGTDVGNAWITPGTSFHYEMGLYAEAGIPPLAILSMATQNGADALGLSESIGTVEVGKQADLVVLGSNPIADIAATRDIQLVLRGGRIVADRSMY